MPWCCCWFLRAPFSGVFFVDPIHAMKNARPWTTGSSLLLLLLVAVHAGAWLTYGAAFWIDSLTYMAVGEAMFHPMKLRHYYDGVGHWGYSHVGGGLPFCWAVLQAFPVLWRWPICSAGQHLAALGACVYAFGRGPQLTWAGAGAALLLSILPFYEAAHQMFMQASAAGYGGEDDAAVIKIFPGIDLPKPKQEG